MESQIAFRHSRVAREEDEIKCSLLSNQLYPSVARYTTEVTQERSKAILPDPGEFFAEPGCNFCKTRVWQKKRPAQGPENNAVILAKQRHGNGKTTALFFDEEIM
ncbi:MAG: hypothetical protein IJR87_11550 [Bacteroidaceae bacterium]|nr:hypothetical protein [Bacteroidaceae bacterium]